MEVRRLATFSKALEASDGVKPRVRTGVVRHKCVSSDVSSVAIESSNLRHPGSHRA
jgi:hypothetical protein